MAVIATKQDTGLSTASGFLASYAANFGVGTTATNYSLATAARILPITFSSNSNCAGIATLFTTGASVQWYERLANDRTVYVDLLQVYTSTTTYFTFAANTVSRTGVSIANDTRVTFAGAGTMPAALSKDTPYWVINSAVGSFQLSLTQGGTAITFGASSGNIYMNTSIAYKSKTAAQINGQIASKGENFFHGYVDFTFTTPVAVTNAASTYSILWSQTGGTTGVWCICPSSNSTSNICYVTYSDTAVTYTDNTDQILNRHRLKLNNNATLYGANPLGETTNFPAIINCSNADETNDATTAAIALLWDDSGVGGQPAASYTVTTNGTIFSGTYSVISLGKTAPVSFTNRGVLTHNPARTAVQFSLFNGTSTAKGVDRHVFEIYGSVPTLPFAYLTVQANSGTSTLYLDRDVSAIWQTNDYLVVCKDATKDYNGSGQFYQIDTVTSTGGGTTSTVVLKTTLATNNRLVGATVMNTTSHYGFYINNSSNTATSAYFSKPTVFKMSGVKTEGFNIQFYNAGQLSTYSTNEQQYLYQDIMLINPSGGAGTYNNGITQAFTPQSGFLMNRIYGNRSWMLGSIFTLYSNSAPAYSSGTLTFQNFEWLDGYGTQITPNSDAKYIIENGRLIQNRNVLSWLRENGIAPILRNVTFWGSAVTNANGGTVQIGASVGARNSGNSFDNCVVGYQNGVYTAIDFQSLDDSFSVSTANTTDIAFFGTNYINVLYKSCTGTPVVDTTYLSSLIPGSYVKLHEINNTAMKHYVYYYNGYISPSGTGLADTTCRTAGGFALRQQSISSVNRFEWVQTVPTGNIQGKDMQIGVWCYINNTAYDAGTYQMPRLSVNYDDGTTVYAEAAAIFGEWQFLPVPFKPTTTFGQVTVTVSSMTDATGSNAYVYFDDFSVIYPAGVQLNLGAIDLWANALPVTPTIATNLSAQDVWNVSASLVNSVGTVGQMIQPITSGTATAGGGTSITLAVGSSATNNLYTGNVIQITSGTGAGQSRFISAYDGSTRVATIYKTWATTPDSSSKYVIRPMGSVEYAVWEALTTDHNNTGTFGEEMNNISSNVETLM